MSWIVQLRSSSAGERYLTQRGKGVTTDRQKAKVFADWAEADSFRLQASRLWPDSQVIPLIDMPMVEPSELERLKQAAQKVATVLSAQLSLRGDRLHHGHRSRPGTCDACDALNELVSLITPPAV